MRIYSAKQIASNFIEKSNSDPENDLINLKDHKILFYTQAEYYQQKHSGVFLKKNR